jgi:hypothetical protein
VFGVSTPHGEGIAQLAFFGLFALQHRGQEAAGIAVSDGSRVRHHKDSGLVANVFNPTTLSPAHRLPRDRPHPVQHHRRQLAEEHPAVRRGDHARPARRRPQRQPGERHGAARRAAGEGVRPHRHQRHRGAHADAGRRRRAHLGGPHRAHAARVEGRLFAGDAGQRSGDRRARPVGLPPDERGPPAPRRLRGRQRDLRAEHARLRRDRRGQARGDRHPARGRDDPPPGAHAQRHPGALHVRVRLLQSPRQRVGRPQRAPRAPAARRAVGHRVRRRRRRGHPGARQLHSRRHRLQPGRAASPTTTG